MGASAWNAPAQHLEPFADGLSLPVDFIPDPLGDSRFYVVQQHGQIRVIQDGTLLDEPFYVADQSNFTTRNWEQGLLGLAFDPDYAHNHRFYIDYTGARGVTHVSRFTASSPLRADQDSEQVLLTVKQPYGNHNGGCIRFGPDGMLYISLGDGGKAHDPHGNGQNPATLLGSILRIDVSGEPDEGLAYAIPEDNPFVGRGGARPEIWLMGLRNAWRYSFDSLGRMWIGDVGQNHWEEVDLVPAGARGLNFGWNLKEGRHRFTPPGQAPRDDTAFKGVDLTDPIWEYEQHPPPRGRGGSVTGGYFYEGKAVPSLKGRYLFADFMMGTFWSFRVKDGRADDVAEHTAQFAEAFGPGGAALAVSSFGRDHAGELYVLDHKGGRVLKVVP